MEEQLFEFEQHTDRKTAAALLRSVADNLDAGEPVTLSAGNDSITLDIPSQIELEAGVEREGSELSVEFELEWDETADGDAQLNVE